MNPLIKVEDTKVWEFDKSINLEITLNNIHIILTTYNKSDTIGTILSDNNEFLTSFNSKNNVNTVFRCYYLIKGKKIYLSTQFILSKSTVDPNKIYIEYIAYKLNLR